MFFFLNFDVLQVFEQNNNNIDKHFMYLFLPYRGLAPVHFVVSKAIKTYTSFYINHLMLPCIRGSHYI